MILVVVLDCESGHSVPEQFTVENRDGIQQTERTSSRLSLRKNGKRKYVWTKDREKTARRLFSPQQ